MKEVNSHYTQHFVDLDKFKSAENIFEIIGDDLPQAIKNAKSLQLTDYNSTYTNSHIIFEEIIKEAKLRGGFYTPETITKFILAWAFNGNKFCDKLLPKLVG